MAANLFSNYYKTLYYIAADLVHRYPLLMSRLIQSLLIPLLGTFLTIAFLLPFGAPSRYNDDLKTAYSVVEWMLSSSIVLGLALPLAQCFRNEIDFGRFSLLQSRILKPLLVIGTLFLSYFIGSYCFQFRPQLLDAIVQLWQTKTFSKGHLFGNYSGPISFFVPQHILFDGGKVYSQYPPGNSIFMLLNEWMPFIKNFSGLVATAVTLIFGHQFCARVYNKNTATLVLLLWSTCGFFLFNTQSYMNHLPGLVFASVFLYYTAVWQESAKTSHLCALALALGALFLCRPLEGLLFAALFGLFNLKSLYNNSLYALAKNALICSFGFWIIGGLFLLFNHYTTGDALLPGYIKLWGESHNIGFHTSPWGQQHTLWRGLYAFYINIKFLNEYLFESPIPPLTILGLYLLIYRNHLSAWDKHLLGYALAIPVCYIFYWHRDSFLGPRFVFISLACLLPLLARSITAIYSSLSGKFLHWEKITRKAISLRNIFVFVLLLSALSSASFGLPFKASIYSKRLPSLKQELLPTLQQAKIKSGIIFIKASWGTRIIALMREMGVSASTVERAYSNYDHCKLWLYLQQAQKQQAQAGQIEQQLLALLSKPDQSQRVNLAGDPTLRAEQETLQSLPKVCSDEINYDKLGFTLFEPHLSLNSINFQPPLIIARDMREHNQVLAEYYPEVKDYYLWQPGKLMKLAHPARSSGRDNPEAAIATVLNRNSP